MADDRELVLTCLIDAPSDKLWRCWTEAQLLKKWFTPPPFSVPHAELDVRAGGSSYVLMKGPNGEEIHNRGIYLEVVKNQRLVFTDAYTKAWVPSAKPFFTGVLSFETQGAKTLYTARALHWTKEDCESHDKMGFHKGWGIATDQLAALARTL